jgi:hypothetical protein
MKTFARLWRGELDLQDAFWTWAVIGGLAVNAVTSFALFLLVTIDQPAPALAAGYGISVPYNLVVTVGVWRAAGRYDGPRRWAEAARIVTVAGMILLSVT